ncbi:hypothetical protein THAOC_08871 [Thalassiosira oceanica]|uniref:UBC core domain-containing protein n=1 Tax=Thalassiosira oceanica TaxID=159749 RepID=K0SXY7_THAOC|nr:hypothetical protein THAOC_08871 [Thalassiosira oceanica]|eukprot:EJK69834.1 hypothetical protein THAOC_08871 [Thalassiosira oceanica]
MFLRILVVAVLALLAQTAAVRKRLQPSGPSVRLSTMSGDAARPTPTPSILASDERRRKRIYNSVDQRSNGLAFILRPSIIAHWDDDVSSSASTFDDTKDRCTETQSHLNYSVMLLRGGAASENNVVQSIIKSILDLDLLPELIKQLITALCQLIENLSGFEILPMPREEERKQKHKSKSKKRRPEESSERVRRKKVDEKDDEFRKRESSSLSRQKSKRKPKVAEESSDDEGPEMPKKSKVDSPTTVTKKDRPKGADAASKKFLSNNLKSSNPNYRIQRELKEFLRSPPPGLSVKISGKNVRLWIITFSMPDDTIYSGETYKLRVQFPADYPTSPPSVYFLSPTPRHEHVYTNGDICLSLLGKDWRPIMTAQSVAQAIMSILCGAQRKSLPMDNAAHAGNKPGQKQDDWVYHDDNC